MPNRHQLQPGQQVNLDKIETRGKKLHDDRDEAEKDFSKLRDELIDLQNLFFANGTRALLVVLQAMDAGGKDSTIRKVFRGVNPQGVRVWGFKKPTPEELAHDFLWRIHHRVPGKGMIGVFNRSHYEDVLVVRVENIVPEDVWKLRYDHINDFEKLLTEAGVKILKFFLHISKEEQKERFQDRLDEPDKHWKFNSEDLQKREKWDDYMRVYEDMLEKCTTKHAPWHVIPADNKWYRNLVITRTIVEAIHEMALRYPAAEEGIQDIKID